MDIVGRLPVILLELDGSNDIQKTYVYANGQILAQYDGPMATADKYFYFHDRLGSVRMLLDEAGAVERMYTYEPFGYKLEDEKSADPPDNPFQFTGQYFDAEINQYYLRARMYDPQLYRFTARDPVLGKFAEPLTLHAYLYSVNDPINYLDPFGRWAVGIGASGSFGLNFKHLRLLWEVLDKGFNACLAKTFAKIYSYSMYAVEKAMKFAEGKDLPGGVGGTAGYALLFAHDESQSLSKGWSSGLMGYAAAGITSDRDWSVSVYVDFLVSWSAQHVRDLAGWYYELGVGYDNDFLPLPLQLLPDSGSYSAGFTSEYSDLNFTGETTGIDLWTFSWSFGYGAMPLPLGLSLHGFVGHSTVWDFDTNEVYN